VEKPYRSGRGEWWQKITCKRRDSFVIVGFEPSTVPGHLGRLLVAALKDDDLVYVGGCGTGWSNQLSRELRLLEGMATKTPPVALRRKGAVFVEPELVADVEYRAWTGREASACSVQRDLGSLGMMRRYLLSNSKLALVLRFPIENYIYPAASCSGKLYASHR
jgi:ATP-dependent DNA ligase